MSQYNNIYCISGNCDELWDLQQPRGERHQNGTVHSLRPRAQIRICCRQWSSTSHLHESSLIHLGGKSQFGFRKLNYQEKNSKFLPSNIHFDSTNDCLELVKGLRNLIFESNSVPLHVYGTQ